MATCITSTAAVDTFYRRLRQTKRNWYLTNARRIRYLYLRLAWEVQHCPLSAVAQSSPGDVADAATRLGISRQVADMIADAADGQTLGPHRRRLLRACGLTEAPRHARHQR
mgnify:CR=1 FL=1